MIALSQGGRMRVGSVTGGWSASVIIPVHNEEVALPRLLSGLRAQDLGRQRLQIIVVVNGSTDSTAAVANGYVDAFEADGHELVIVEIATASKSSALNEGDRHTKAFPRLYLDADIEMSPTAIRRTIEVLSSTTEPRLAAPRVEMGPSALSMARSYGRVWSQLPYVRTQVPGVGFYAVNELGRARWWRFPTRVGADDKFVRLHFTTGEVVVIDDASFTVYLPDRLGELLRVRGRWNSLNRQIVRHCPGLDRQDRSRWIPSALYMMTTISSWPDVPVFLAVWFAAWSLSLLSRLGSGERWSRADSSPMRKRLPLNARTPPSSRPTRSQRTTKVVARRRVVHAIIVTFDSLETVKMCIDRLLASEGLDDLRITVVDNASNDGTPLVLRSKYSDIEVIANPTNVGFGAAVNQAASGTLSTWIAIINPDVEVRPDTLAACVNHLECNPDVGSCGVRAVHADGSVNDRSFFTRPTGWSEIALAIGAQRLALASRVLNPEQRLAYISSTFPIGVDIVAGCFNVIDADLFRHLAGYDEAYFVCGEDFDLGVRAVQAGAAPEILPVCPIIRHSQKSFKSGADAKVAYLRGRAQFERRWWPRHRAAFGRLARTLGVLSRVALLGARCSASRAEFGQVWARRAEWT